MPAPRIRHAYYYPEILRTLLEDKRIHVPELTDESPFEPSNQIYSGIAFALHVYNQTAELVANESQLQSARLRESLRAHARHVGYSLGTARPASADLVLQLSKEFPTTSRIEVVPEGASFGAEVESDEPAPVFESIESVSVSTTDVFSFVLTDQQGVWTDHTANALSDLPGTEWSPWPQAPQIGDCIYFMHQDVMWDAVDFVADTEAVSTDGVWECYQGEWQRSVPDSIVQEPNGLRLVINDYLGAHNRQQTTIRVTLKRTGVYEEVQSTWTGSENVVNVSLLGQSEVSLNPDDYAVGSQWEPLMIAEPGTDAFGQTIEMPFELPQTQTATWRKVSIDGSPPCYAIRYRQLLDSQSQPVFLSAKPSGKAYVAAKASQGQTKTGELLGTSDGTPNQRFQTTLDNFIDDGRDELLVDGETWTRVATLIDSAPDDRHYMIELEKDERATVRFGDGQQGAVSPLHAEILFTYRTNAHQNGNVGAGTMTQNRSSLAFISKVWNPKSSHGWSPPEGTTPEDFEALKERIPVSVREKDVAHSVDGIVHLAETYTNSGGSLMVSRVFAIENGFGPNTVELVVVGIGGRELSHDDRREMERFFNGDRSAHPLVPARVVPNLRVHVTNAARRVIDLRATIVVSSATVTKEQIDNHLREVVAPTRKTQDRLRYEWGFGETVALSRLKHEIHRMSRDTLRVEIEEPLFDVQVRSRELPEMGEIVLTLQQGANQ